MKTGWLYFYACSLVCLYPLCLNCVRINFLLMVCSLMVARSGSRSRYGEACPDPADAIIFSSTELIFKGTGQGKLSIKTSSVRAVIWASLIISRPEQRQNSLCRCFFSLHGFLYILSLIAAVGLLRALQRFFLLVIQDGIIHLLSCQVLLAFR